MVIKKLLENLSHVQSNTRGTALFSKFMGQHHLFSLEDFDQDVTKLVDQFKSLPVAAQHSSLLADFQNRWQDSREKLSIKLHRRKV